RAQALLRTVAERDPQWRKDHALRQKAKERRLAEKAARAAKATDACNERATPSPPDAEQIATREGLLNCVTESEIATATPTIPPKNSVSDDSMPPPRGVIKSDADEADVGCSSPQKTPEPTSTPKPNAAPRDDRRADDNVDHEDEDRAYYQADARKWY